MPRGEPDLPGIVCYDERGRRVTFEPVEYFDDRGYWIIDDKGKRRAFYPSSTTILGASPNPYRATWRGNIGNREADRRLAEAQERGRRVHYACEVILQGGGVVYEPEFTRKENFSAAEIKKLHHYHGEYFLSLSDQNQYLMAYRWLQWVKIVKPRLLAVEATVYSDVYQVAGTLDVFVEVDPGTYFINAGKPITIPRKGRIIIDFKTGQPNDDHIMQLASYYKMVLEQVHAQNNEPEDDLLGGMLVYLNSKTTRGIAGLTTQFITAEELEKDFLDFEAVHIVWKRKNPNFNPVLMQFPPYISLFPLATKPKRNVKPKVKKRKAVRQRRRTTGSSDRQEGEAARILPQ